MQNSSLYGCQWHTMLKPVRERDYEKPRALYPSFDAKSSKNFAKPSKYWMGVN